MREFQYKGISPIRYFPEVNLLMSHPVLKMLLITHARTRTHYLCALLTVMATGMTSVILRGISFHYRMFYALGLQKKYN